MSLRGICQLRLQGIVADTYVVVVCSSTKEDGANGAGVSVNELETLINIPIPIVQRNASLRSQHLVLRIWNIGIIPVDE